MREQGEPCSDEQERPSNHQHWRRKESFRRRRTVGDDEGCSAGALIGLEALEAHEVHHR